MTARRAIEKAYEDRLQARLVARLGGCCKFCGALAPLEFAHIAPTPILRFNRGRGRKLRLLDVQRNIDKYILACDVCHDELDGRAPRRIKNSRFKIQESVSQIPNSERQNHAENRVCEASTVQR